MKMENYHISDAPKSQPMPRNPKPFSALLPKPLTTWTYLRMA